MQKFSRRKLLLAGAAAAAVAGPTLAQDAYPVWPVRVVIPYGAAGGTATVYRILQRNFEKAMGGTLVAGYAGRAGNASPHQRSRPPGQPVANTDNALG